MVSIIIPVYNVEQWLDRCIESVINQTYHNIEILLIDDGSTDASSTICDEWAKKDSRIVVYHKKNEGLGSARNFGLRNAHGEYVAFIDSDDSVDLQYIECLNKAISISDADFVSSNYKEFDCISGEVTYRCLDLAESVYETDAEKELVLYIIYPMLWGKMFKKSFLIDNDIMQPSIKHEDNAVCPIYVLTASKIMHINAALYIYSVNRKGSIMSTGQCWNDIYKGMEYYLEYFIRHELFDKYYDILKLYIISIISYYSKTYDREINMLDIYKRFFKKSIDECSSILCQNKKIIIFGAGQIGKKMFEYIDSDKISFIADNNPDLLGAKVCGKEVIDFEMLKHIHNDYIIVLSIGKVNYIHEVLKSFNDNNISNYIYYFDMILNYIDSFNGAAEQINIKSYQD